MLPGTLSLPLPFKEVKLVAARVAIRRQIWPIDARAKGHTCLMKVVDSSRGPAIKMARGVRSVVMLGAVVILTKIKRVSRAQK
jgi:hypothetical protein